MNSKTVDLATLSPYARYVQNFYGTHTNYHIPWRLIYDYEMIFVVKGECVVKTSDSTYTLHENDLHIMKPFLRHTRYVPEGKIFHYYSIHFDLFYDVENMDFSAHDIYEIPCWQLVEESPVDDKLQQRTIYKADELNFKDKVHIENSSEMLHYLNEVYCAFTEKSVSYELKMRAGLLNIFALLIEQIHHTANTNTTNEQIVSDYLQYIITNYNKEINLSDIVNNHGLSPSHFRRIFKQITNKAPHEYLIDYRMEQAKKLLLTKRYTVSQISYMIGYDDIHYFSKLFKNKEGISPKNFLSNINNMH